jgi:hypothetical protein
MAQETVMIRVMVTVNFGDDDISGNVPSTEAIALLHTHAGGPPTGLFPTVNLLSRDVDDVLPFDVILSCNHGTRYSVPVETGHNTVLQERARDGEEAI